MEKLNLGDRDRAAVVIAAVCLAAFAACTYTPPTLPPMPPGVAPSLDASIQARADGGAPPDRTPSPDRVALPDVGPVVPVDGPPLPAPADAGLPSPPDAAVFDAAPACVPRAEVCNGADDDCDGVADDGCPVDNAPLVTQGPVVSSPVFGSLNLDGSVPVVHRCPPGQVVVAITGNSGYALDSLGVVCATLRVREDRGAMPYRYPLALEMGRTFPPVGGTSGGENTATRCPPGFVVSGISGWPSMPTGACPANYCAGVTAPTCPTNFGLEIFCSRYEIAGAPGSFRLARIDEPPFRTAARVEVDLAPFGFPSRKAEYPCPPDQVVVEAAGGVGPWPYDCAKTTVNGLRASCTRPTVQQR